VVRRFSSSSLGCDGMITILIWNLSRVFEPGWGGEKASNREDASGFA